MRLRCRWPRRPRHGMRGSRDPGPSRCSWCPPGDRVLGQLATVELPLLAPAVEQLDVVVAIQLEVPVRVRGEPVVVAAVEHHGVLVGDALVRQQLLELLLADEVPADLILQFGLPVQLDGAIDVATVICEVSSSTSTKTTPGVFRVSSAQSAETIILAAHGLVSSPGNLGACGGKAGGRATMGRRRARSHARHGGVAVGRAARRRARGGSLPAQGMRHRQLPTRHRSTVRREVSAVLTAQSAMPIPVSVTGPLHDSPSALVGAAAAHAARVRPP